MKRIVTLVVCLAFLVGSVGANVNIDPVKKKETTIVIDINNK